jgi:hypothetical protein
MLMNKNYKIENVLFRPKDLKGLGLTSADIMVLLKIAYHCTICDLENEYGGQVCEWVIPEILEEEGIKKNTINYSLKKLIKNNILIKNDEMMYYQLNPKYIWIPGDDNNPSQGDKSARDALIYTLN